MPGSGGGHEYAFTSQAVTCYGGEGYPSAFDPYTQWEEEFSLMQIALARGSGNGQQTVEAGWQNYRDLYGDWVPHLFVYYTTNGYTDNDDDEGGYNEDVDGWVQYDDSVYPEAISSPNSTRGGSQDVMRIKYQLYEGNWWLSCNSRWIGYYPASLFNSSGLRNKASSVDFYGEVVDSSEHSSSSCTRHGKRLLAGIRMDLVRVHPQHAISVEHRRRHDETQSRHYVGEQSGRVRSDRTLRQYRFLEELFLDGWSGRRLNS